MEAWSHNGGLLASAQRPDAAATQSGSAGVPTAQWKTASRTQALPSRSESVDNLIINCGEECREIQGIQ
jgi:hypothetical protein